MPLDFSDIEQYITENREIMTDKVLLRHDRYKILALLKDKVQALLADYETLETCTIPGLLSRIEKASEYADLKECHEAAQDAIRTFFVEQKAIPDVHDLFRITRDAITIRVLRLVEQEMEGEGFHVPPADYVWIGLGSEGRDEQTMLTDQDNMVIFGTGTGKGDSATAQIERYFEEFSNRSVDRLDKAGFQKCKGGVMPSNVKWRGSVETWKKRLEDRITYERGEFESLDMIILTDARPVAGNTALLNKLTRYFFQRLSNSSNIMKDFIRSAVLMPTAITFFGNFKVEKSGEHKDMFNLKLLGVAPLVLSVRMLAISSGIYETNTLKRIRLLREKKVIKKDMETDLMDAYIAFGKFRIMNQIQKREENKGAVADTNYVKPGMLGAAEQEKMRKAMKSVEALQRYMEEILLFGQPI